MLCGAALPSAEKLARLPAQPVQPLPLGRRARPHLGSPALDSFNPGEPSPVGQEKPKKPRESLWAAEGVIRCLPGPAGAAALVCVRGGG